MFEFIVLLEYPAVPKFQLSGWWFKVKLKNFEVFLLLIYPIMFVKTTIAQETSLEQNASTSVLNSWCFGVRYLFVAHSNNFVSAEYKLRLLEAFDLSIYCKLQGHYTSSQKSFVGHIWNVVGCLFLLYFRSVCPIAIVYVFFSQFN